MGSRRAGDYSKFAGKGNVAKQIKVVEKSLETNKPANVVVSTAINVIAASNPTINALIQTYKLSKWAYETYQKAEKAYEKTSDVNDSLKVVGTEIVKYGLATLRDVVIGAVVDIGWGSIKASTGIKTNELQDSILRAATKNTLEKVLPGD
jgi:methylthioribose-1-phosphate isomerase